MLESCPGMGTSHFPPSQASHSDFQMLGVVGKMLLPWSWAWVPITFSLMGLKLCVWGSSEKMCLGSGIRGTARLAPALHSLRPPGSCWARLWVFFPCCHTKVHLTPAESEYWETLLKHHSSCSWPSYPFCWSESWSVGLHGGILIGAHPQFMNSPHTSLAECALLPSQTPLPTFFFFFCSFSLMFKRPLDSAGGLPCPAPALWTGLSSRCPSASWATWATAMVDPTAGRSLCV